MPFALVKFDNPNASPATAWQEVDANGNLVGLFDNEGDRVHVGNCSWTILDANAVPPFAE
jgi:hypothetical protein